MKCTDKAKKTKHSHIRGIVLTIAALVVLLLLGSCGQKTYELENAYDVYGTSIHYQQPEQEDGLIQPPASDHVSYFAQELCVADDVMLGTNEVNEQAAEAFAVFNLSRKEATRSKNIYEKLYPASTTKILTAYLALKYGTLSDVVTVSEAAANQASDSSVCNIRAGDQITLEELLYGLLLKSGNDAADAIAEYISGSTKEFAKLMNQEAAALGATHSHFVNPHGLQDEAHYTCVYDLYLLFQKALEYEEFEKIIHAVKHVAVYKDSSGNKVTQEWLTTNQFLNETTKTPKGVTVIGGKTGTTNDAGYCLVLYSKNKSQEPVISIVMKAESRDSLYSLMSELLSRAAK